MRPGHLSLPNGLGLTVFGGFPPRLRENALATGRFESDAEADPAEAP